MVVITPIWRRPNDLLKERENLTKNLFMFHTEIEGGTFDRNIFDILGSAYALATKNVENYAADVCCCYFFGVPVCIYIGNFDMIS